MKVLVVGGQQAYENMFIFMGYALARDIKDAELVCFTGGADVSPELYGEAEHPRSSCSPMRDAMEEIIYQEAIVLSTPMVGICRGGQFLHVMNGGELYQHVGGHATGSPHKAIHLPTGEEVCVTSTHHQMMKYKGFGELICTANEASFKQYMKDGAIQNSASVGQDVEVMWYEDTKCLCFQPHPEFSHSIESAESTYLYFKNLLEVYLNV